MASPYVKTVWVTGDAITQTKARNWEDGIESLSGGGVAIASQAALDFLYASSASQLARLAAGSALQYPRINAAGNGWEFAAPAAQYMTLLKAGSGTSTNAAAENVDTVAISGLTVKDKIRVLITHSSVTQLTTIPVLYQNTDGIWIVNTSGGNNIAAGEYSSEDVVFGPDQSDSKMVVALNVSGRNTTTADGIGSVRTGRNQWTTDWTGAWTLALRHGGVTAGGTYRWSWAVYKIAGQ